MSIARFNHVRVAGAMVSLPSGYIDIDDEIEYFGNNPRRLERQKKMIGFGRRFVADELTTGSDLALDAARKLMDRLGIRPEGVGALIVVGHTPDYLGPCDACILHGKLGLRKGIPALDVNLGCSGYLYGLWLAHSLIESGAVGSVLLLAGDIVSTSAKASNRKRAPLFSDSGSATYLCRSETVTHASFVLGTDGTGWEHIVKPIGGSRIPFSAETIGLRSVDGDGNEWTSEQEIMSGEDVFAFTMDVVPALIRETVSVAGWTNDDVDLFALHQANKQIVEMLISKSGIPADKTPTDVFSRYANTTANSVLTVLCDSMDKLAHDKVVMASFGAGLSWAGAALTLSEFIGGIATYVPSAGRPTRQEQIEHWLQRFREG